MVKPKVKKTRGLKCVVHYENQKKYSRIKELSEANENRILEAKRKRIEIGGEHLYEAQCNNIPDEGFDLIHHLDPCYKR